MPQRLTPPDGTRPDSNQPATAVSSKRTSEQEKKLGLEKALKLYKWLVPNMDKFLSELDATYRALWTEEGVQGQVLGPTAPAGPSLLASNHISITQVTNTA